MINDLFLEIYSSIPRQGPGSKEITQLAFSKIANLPAAPSILDMGCGTGLQSIELVHLSGGTVIAVDNLKPFVDKLTNLANEQGITENLIAVCSDMQTLNYAPQSFDLIWSEGAIYNIGFENGLTIWKNHLRPNGYMAVSELCWIKENPPQEIVDYWSENYPAMKTIEQNCAIINECEYKLIDKFVFPASAWWDDYYTPISQIINKLKEENGESTDSEEVFNEMIPEMEMHKKYGEYYSYVFFIMRNR